MATLMEIECSKCQRKFNSMKEDADICPECLKNEFTVKAEGLDAEEHAELVAEYKNSLKRQSLRAEQMGSMYATGQAFSIAGKLRFSLGFAIFLICCFLFLVSDKYSGVTFLAELDIESQRIFSMILCVVSSILIGTCSIRFRKLAWLFAALVLGMG